MRDFVRHPTRSGIVRLTSSPPWMPSLGDRVVRTWQVRSGNTDKLEWREQLCCIRVGNVRRCSNLRQHLQHIRLFLAVPVDHHVTSSIVCSSFLSLRLTTQDGPYVRFEVEPSSITSFGRLPYLLSRCIVGLPATSALESESFISDSSSQPLFSLFRAVSYTHFGSLPQSCKTCVNSSTDHTACKAPSMLKP
jgi:hypothetical protein